MHCLWTHKLHFSITFSLKMGHTVLFTHLKIILLQYFQFSVFSFSKISSIQTDPNVLKTWFVSVQKGFYTWRNDQKQLSVAWINSSHILKPFRFGLLALCAPSLLNRVINEPSCLWTIWARLGKKLVLYLIF